MDIHSVEDSKLISYLLDNECEPQNPLVINLHCRNLYIHWELVEKCFVPYDDPKDIKWNKYKIVKIIVE